MLCSPMFFSIILLPSFLHRSFGIESFLPTLTTSEEDGGAEFYPSYIRKVWSADRQGPKPWNSEMSFDAAFEVSGPENINDFPKSQASLQKRRSMRLMPRIGRKKRSIKDKTRSKTVQETYQELRPDNFLTPVWNQGKDLDTINKRKPRRVVFIPRIGKRLLEDEEDIYEKRAIFMPRVGRGPLIPNKELLEDEENLDEKRAIFMPRGGRSPLISNMGLLGDEENFDEKRAIFIPRVGRSSVYPKLIRYKPNMKYKIASRAIFIPRIG